MNNHSRLILLVIALASLTFTVAKAVEPQSTGTYDTAGLIAYQLIKKSSDEVIRAVQFEKGQDYKSAYKAYWTGYLKNAGDTQSIIGIVRCTRRLKVYDQAISEISSLVKKRKISDWSDKLLLGLLVFFEAEAKQKSTRSLGHESMVKYALYDPKSRKDFGVKLMVCYTTSSISESRKLAKELVIEHPKVEGLVPLRIWTLARGVLGTYVTNSKGQTEKISTDEDRPKYHDAEAILKPYLQMEHPPTWAYYWGAIIYKALGQADIASRCASRVRAASSHDPVILKWKQDIEKMSL